MAVEQEQLGVTLGVGADQAWERVVSLEATVGARLYGYAVHLGVDGPRANDLVQDVLLRLWRELRRGVVIASPEPWLFRTVSRLAMDEHRLHQEGYLRPQAVRRIWLDHLSGHREHSSPLWSLLTFQAWHETWMKGDHAAKADAAA